MSNNARVIKLAVQKVEDYKEVKSTNTKWVFWGENNDYPQKLIKLFNQSAKHGAIVTGKASYISGSAIKSENESAEADVFLKRINPTDTAEAFLRKVVTDGRLFGGHAILVVPNLTKERAASFYHVDISKCRLSEDCKTVFISDEWEKVKKGKPKNFKTVKIFDGTYNEESIIWYASYRPAMGIYPQPEYTQGLAAIETDARVSNFHLNNLRNGFFANKIINVNSGELSQNADGQDAFVSAIEDKFTSDENAGNFMVVFNNGSEQATTVTDLSAGDFGEQFGQLRKDTEQEIFIAHKIPSPMLFGVRVEGQLGGRNELLEAFELFNQTYVEQERLFYEKLLNDLAKLKGINDTFTIVPFEPMQKQMSESVMMQVLTKDEIREMYGFEKMEVQAANNATSDAINSLSPLVANKVLESMTPNEIRALVALPPTADGANLTKPVQFNKQSDDADVAVFMKYGKEKDNYEKISSIELRYLAIKDMENYHQSFNDIQKNEGVSEDEKRILKQIENGKQPKIENKTLEKLRTKKLVEVDRESGALKLTQLGGLILTDLQPNRELAKLKTVYEYVKRPDATGPDVLPDGRTRPFCEAMVNSNKYFSREDINNISAELGYDVWQHRGGWFTMPNGNHRPSCRHIWNAVLVAEK